MLVGFRAAAGDGLGAQLGEIGSDAFAQGRARQLADHDSVQPRPMPQWRLDERERRNSAEIVLADVRARKASAARMKKEATPAKRKPAHVRATRAGPRLANPSPWKVVTTTIKPAATAGREVIHRQFDPQSAPAGHRGRTPAA